MISVVLAAAALAGGFQQVGAIFTVEPGVYLPERGFGVRIEDEVIITPTGYRLLTEGFPRKLEDVEAWVLKARKP